MGLLVGSLHAAIPTLKVLIGRSLQDVRIEATDLQKHLPTKNTFQNYSGRKMIRFNCRRGIASDTINRPVLLASLTSATGLVSWDKKPYQGELHLTTNSESKDGCDLVNNISIESYISTLLSKEMNKTWPIEVLKAQAVAARSYALYKRQQAETTGLYHLESSEKDQVAGSYFDMSPKTNLATKNTEGEILIGMKGELIPVYYHSKCGGRTIEPQYVWSGKVEGYTSVECPYCHRYGMKKWEYSIPKKQFWNMVGSNNILLEKDVSDKPEFTIYSSLGDGGKVIKKSMLRNIYGREKFPSNHYSLQEKDDMILVKGEGYGHGVGLCQLGALDLAQKGMNYHQILKYYFPHFSVKKIY